MSLYPLPSWPSSTEVSSGLLTFCTSVWFEPCKASDWNSPPSKTLDRNGAWQESNRSPRMKPPSPTMDSFPCWPLAGMAVLRELSTRVEQRTLSNCFYIWQGSDGILWSRAVKIAFHTSYFKFVIKKNLLENAYINVIYVLVVFARGNSEFCSPCLESKITVLLRSRNRALCHSAHFWGTFLEEHHIVGQECSKHASMFSVNWGKLKHHPSACALSKEPYWKCHHWLHRCVVRRLHFLLLKASTRLTNSFIH